MSSRIRAIDSHEVHPVSGWQACRTAPDAVSDPASASLAWGPATRGSEATAAASLIQAGALDPGLERAGSLGRLDADDWWFRTTLPAVTVGAGEELALQLDGIATVADVWLDGHHLLASDNMFRSHERILAQGGGELVVRCRALDALLAAKRPRPRWRAPMIEHQQLRWFRTTLLGRTPGWSPPLPAIGPWRGARIVRRRGVSVDDVRLQTSLAGTAGVVDVTVRARALGTAALGEIDLVVEREAKTFRARLEARGDGAFGARLEIPGVERWWPHTHGVPALYTTRLVIRGAQGPGTTVDLGAVGFREITLSTEGGGFALSVNGAPIFCRGACWTPLDVVRLTADRAACERALRQVAAAGMNMLRVGGTMVYESDDFHDLLDQLGILLWQDFMFANMDYPEDDAAFVTGVSAEVHEVLGRLGGRPSLAVLCGNSEGEQQAAMFGAPRERWSPLLFHEIIPAIAKERLPDVPYWPSSAHGGAFPHEARVGTTSYYGVGAYLRPLDDARRSEVRFASECLAFANVPERTPPSHKVQSPAWKARTPRDLGAGWDFDDVRDHYVARLFGVDPAATRYADHDRYLDLGRAATGEVMSAVFGEWRRPGSTCRGGLVWFLRDLWAGAGWGVVDAAGDPKPSYWYLRRALAPVLLHVSDEGQSGLYVHVVNDGKERLEGELEIALFRAGEIATGSGRRAVAVDARAGVSVPAAELFDGFMDLSYTYRFGPPSCDLVVATLRPVGGPPVSAFHFPVGLPSRRELDLGLVASAAARDGGAFEVSVRTRRFAQSVVVEADGFVADDAWFHLPPGGERTLTLHPAAGAPGPLRGTVRALNGENSSKIVVP